MLYFKKYLSQKRWKWYLIAYVGSILIGAYLARRGGLVMSVLYLVLAWGMYLLNDKRTSKLKMVFMALIVIGLIYILFSNMADSFFSTLLERGDENTRDGVEVSFYADMKSQTDWIFGRGWFGQYYEPIFKTYRSSIETGFLAIVLPIFRQGLTLFC